jgi:hypothetical protein
VKDILLVILTQDWYLRKFGEDNDQAFDKWEKSIFCKVVLKNLENDYC